MNILARAKEYSGHLSAPFISLHARPNRLGFVEAGTQHATSKDVLGKRAAREVPCRFELFDKSLQY
jgi:hypothetical protein